MEDLITRFQHISEQIFEQLDNKSLTTCRKVSKSWQKFVDNKNFAWIRIVNFPTIPLIFTANVNLQQTYLHVAAKTGQIGMFKMILESEEVKNPKSDFNVTPFHVACYFGQYEIAKMLFENYVELKINLNELGSEGRTSLHMACERGHYKIVKMLTEERNVTKNAKSAKNLRV